MEKQQSFDLEPKQKGSVECLGMTFKSDQARRAYFLERLQEKLQDPEFRRIPGFPKGTDEDILRMSDPPYYTACPNQFLMEFVRVYGRPYDANEEVHREPFAVDVSVGKTDALYKAHGYHTKVPHLAIVPSILHYTEPGDIVLDGFAGSGMTGVAAQWCGSAPLEYRKQIDEQWTREGRGRPKWGKRRAILNDLGPAATFIAANYILPFDIQSFVRTARQILVDVEQELGWMYETLHTDGKTVGRINYTVWSEVLSCSECAGEIVFIEEALDTATNRIASEITCHHCSAIQTKENMDLQFETYLDPFSGMSARRPKRKPVIINYRVGKKTYEKKPDARDIAVLERIGNLCTPQELPSTLLPDCQMTRVGRMATTEIRAVHHMFLPRPAQALAVLWRLASNQSDHRLRNVLLFFVEQAIWGMSVLARYTPSHFSQVNQYLSGVFYVGSQIVDVSPWYILEGKLERLSKALAAPTRQYGDVVITTGDCARLNIDDSSVDYIFTDPPFGENIYYSDLNFLVESWHRVFTDSTPEAIIDKAKGKGLYEYQSLMKACFDEYARVLKPGKWMTVVFSNSSNAVWRAIQEALGTAGFVVADVRTLDKKHGSFRQMTSTAVKQDLIISAYKPTTTLEQRFALGTSAPEDAWAFVDQHLSYVPVFTGANGVAEVVAERTAQVLHDHMVAFHVQHHLSVPLSTAEFLAGLAQRYSERDGMYFLHDQVLEYDTKRAKVETVQQLSFLVTDEASAILWVRAELERKPQSFQDLNPVFMREIQNWAVHERTVELKQILEENFLLYDGTGTVPAQIHTYLSTNFKDMRGLFKDDPTLRAKAADRCYVPDPNKQSDLDQLRSKRLLKEFAEYRESKQKKLKLFRTEAVRAGFKAAYDQKDYRTIVDVARKLPEKVIQEDEKLLMYYDVALMRLGED